MDTDDVIERGDAPAIKFAEGVASTTVDSALAAQTGQSPTRAPWP